MSTGTEIDNRYSLDWLRWVAVGSIILGGIVGNWYYQDQSLLLRVLALVILSGLAVFIAARTYKGSTAWGLLKDARAEIRRVVWPTREEVTQTTMIVLALVLVFALILWLLDSGLSWLVSSVIG